MHWPNRKGFFFIKKKMGKIQINKNEPIHCTRKKKIKRKITWAFKLGSTWGPRAYITACSIWSIFRLFFKKEKKKVVCSWSFVFSQQDFFDFYKREKRRRKKKTYYRTFFFYLLFFKWPIFFLFATVTNHSTWFLVFA